MSDGEPLYELDIPLAEGRTLRLVLEHSYLAQHPHHGEAVDLVLVEGSVRVSIATIGPAGLRSLAASFGAAAHRLERTPEEPAVGSTEGDTDQGGPAAPVDEAAAAELRAILEAADRLDRTATDRADALANEPELRRAIDGLRIAAAHTRSRLDTG